MNVAALMTLFLPSALAVGHRCLDRGPPWPWLWGSRPIAVAVNNITHSDHSEEAFYSKCFVAMLVVAMLVLGVVGHYHSCRWPKLDSPVSSTHKSTESANAVVVFNWIFLGLGLSRSF